MSASLDIIIPTFRDTTRAVGCIRLLASLAAASQAPVRIVMVDNEGDPALGKALEAFPVTYLVEKQPGSYAARNTGLSATDGSIIAFTDSDCSPDENWITRSRETLGLHGADIAVGPVVIYSENKVRPTGWEVIDMVFAFPIEERVRTGGWGVTANLVASRDCFGKAGYFDSSLMSGGDAAWCRQAVSKGCKLIYDPQLIVRHPARATASEHLTKIRRIAGGLAATARKDGTTGRLFRGAIGSIIPPVNKWKKVMKRTDIPAASRLSALLCLSITKWAYGFALIKQLCFPRAQAERR